MTTQRTASKQRYRVQHELKSYERAESLLDIIVHLYASLPGLSSVLTRMIGLLGACVLRLKIYGHLPRTLRGALMTASYIRSFCSDATGYGQTSYSVLRYVLRYVGSGDVFVDLGCGKGRVIRFVASRRKLEKVIGIEIVPELAQIARSGVVNVDLIAPVEVIEGDATSADLSQGTVYYLYNPFGRKTLRKVLRNIRKTLDSNPRRIRIIYSNPVWAALLDGSSWLTSEQDKALEKEQKRVSLRVWHN